jgi:capsular polysaccharide biosynthesis protein/MinD-like ATPase involved in chromosome partitioning or flagellar assembly
VDATAPTSPDLSDYLGLLRRQWWVVLLVTLFVVGAAYGVTQAMPREYESVTSVLVQPAGQDTNVVGGRTKDAINLDTEAQLVRSTAIAAGAASLLRATEAHDDLARGVAVEVPPNTSVLKIKYTAPDPSRAQMGSHAFAEAYLRNRDATAQADIDAQVAALTSKVKQLNATLTQVGTRLGNLSETSPQRPALESQRITAQNQLNNVSEKINDLTTVTVSGGTIISDARLPTAPTKPNRTLNFATGAMLGLLLGFAVAVARERLDRRVRQAADVERDGRVPVLAELAGEAAPRFDQVLAPHAAGGRTFNRLRNEVLASLRPQDRIVVVTGASRGAAATLVAANLAAAMARAGAEVVLVGAHHPDSLQDAAPLARLFGVAATPGLSDVLAGKVALADALQRAPRVPSLHVITTGGTASAAGLLQSQALRDALTLLRRHDAYVVIEAPSTASSADAQSLARLADAAILAVELRRTRRPEVADATAQLSRVGTPLLGAVVLPRLAPVPAADDADIAVDADWDEDDDRVEARGDTRADSRADSRAEEPAAAARPRLKVRLSNDEPTDLSAAGLTEFDLTGTSLLRGRPAAPHHRRPAPARHDSGGASASGPIENDTAVLRRLDPETLREMDRAASGRNLNGRNAGDAAGD